MGDSFKGILHITRVGIFGLVADKSTKMLTKVEMRYEFALTSCMAAQGGLEVWCGTDGEQQHAPLPRSSSTNRLFALGFCLSATIGPYEGILPKPTQPTPDAASCPPTASHTPDYVWHARHELGAAVEAHFWCILQDTKCSHDSSIRPRIMVRAETAPSFQSRPAKPPAIGIAPGSPTKEILVVTYYAHAHILHAHRFYSAILNMPYNASALRATATTTNTTYTASTQRHTA